MGDRGPPPKTPKLKIKHERGIVHASCLILQNNCIYCDPINLSVLFSKNMMS